MSYGKGLNFHYPMDIVRIMREAETPTSMGPDRGLAQIALEALSATSHFNSTWGAPHCQNQFP